MVVVLVEVVVDVELLLLLLDRADVVVLPEVVGAIVLVAGAIALVTRTVVAVLLLLGAIVLVTGDMLPRLVWTADEVVAGARVLLFVYADQ